MARPWRRRLQEQLPPGVEAEFERHKRRCRKLREDFEQRLAERDGTRDALSAASGEVGKLQGRGVSLLGELNAAMREGNEKKIKNIQASYEKFSRELDRAQAKRERIAKKLSDVDFDDQEVTHYLMRAGQKQLEDAENRIQELKDLFDALLQEQHRQIAEAAGLLSAEYESRNKNPEKTEDD